MKQLWAPSGLAAASFFSKSHSSAQLLQSPLSNLEMTASFWPIMWLPKNFKGLDQIFPEIAAIYGSRGDLAAI